MLLCLEKDPKDRPASAAALYERIEDVERAIGPWSTDQAEAWWHDRSDEVLRRVQQTRELEMSSEGVKTMAVDVSRRHARE